MTSVQPPSLPAGAVYTSCYCEENVYLLCKTFLSTPGVPEKWKIWAVFISNKGKRAALFFQKAARQEQLPVVWDYHVVLVLEPREEGISEESKPPSGRSWVYDFDTRLPMPCSWKEYVELTFPVDLLPEYQSRFRVVAGDEYVENFASDRSHMIDEEATEKCGQVRYSATPPGYEAIVGPAAGRRGETTNLMRAFVSMSETSGTFGTVYSRSGIDV